jgi:type IV pilus assembly protein PilM
VISEAGNVVSAVGKEKGEIQAREDEVRKILAGQDERINWVRLNEFINQSLPIPGEKEQGGNMYETEDQRRLWFTPGGQRAYEKYRERLKAGLDPTIGWDDETRAALAMVEIEGVHTRYTDNLGTYFEKAKAVSKAETLNELDGMIEEHRTKAPEGAGWVVEVRGVTYYNQGEIDGRNLVLKTLIPNLTKLGKDAPTSVEVKPMPEAKKEEAKKAEPKKVDGKEEAKQDEPKKDEAAPMAPATPEEPKPVVHPVRGKVSHVFLYDCYDVPNPVQDKFEYLGQAPLIDSLVTPIGGGDATSAAVVAGAATPGGPGGPTTAARSWKPLGQGPAAGTGTGSGGGGVSTPMSGPMSGSGGGTTTNGYTRKRGTAGSVEAKSAVRTKVRFEFIVLMIWKEDTPSDKFIPADDGTGIDADTGDFGGPSGGPGGGGGLGSMGDDERKPGGGGGSPNSGKSDG